MVDINNLSTSIMNELQRYRDVIVEDMETAKKETAKELVQDLKATSPRRKNRGKNYYKGWRIKNVRGKLIIHNATNYQLTHLLENGHAKIGGGRVAPIVHIKPAEEKAIENFINKIERAID